MADQDKYFVFYNHIPNSTFIFPDGQLAQFTNGRYVTQDPVRASLLTSEVQRGNQSIYVDPTKLTATEEELDPMAEYKARVIAEYLAKQGGEVEASASDSGKLNVTDTASVGEAGSGVPKLSISK